MTKNNQREGSALIPYHGDNPFTEALLDWAEKPVKKPSGGKKKMAKRETVINKSMDKKGRPLYTVVDKNSGEPLGTLYSPAQRREKYCYELKHKKNARKGTPLSVTQLAYRSGYMAANKEQTRIFKKKNPGYQRKGN